MKATVALLIALLMPVQWQLALAAVPPDFPVDANVESVRTGGYWKMGSQDGRYRVVIAYLGFEHISSHVRIEWLATPGEDGEVRIIRTVVLSEALLGSVDIESMRPDKTETTVIISGVLHDDSKYRCQLLLRIDGTYSRGATC